LVPTTTFINVIIRYQWFSILSQLEQVLEIVNYQSWIRKKNKQPISLSAEDTKTQKIIQCLSEI
jgi:hypothetical protein